METIKISSSTILDHDNSAPARGDHRTGQKPRQTKSRNGCITCKTKRLKCDEIKPSCRQCERRKVQCGGYRKDFKWRPFGETKGKKANSPSNQPPCIVDVGIPSPPTTEKPASPIRIKSYNPRGFHTPPCSPLHSPPISIDSFLSTDHHTVDDLFMVQEDVSMTNCNTSPFNVDVSLSAESPRYDFLPYFEPFQGSPSLAESLVSDADVFPGSNIPFISEQPAEPSFSQLLEDENDNIEEIIRQSDPGLGPWNLSLPDEDVFAFDTLRIPSRPPLPMDSSEMLVLRFDKLTCGILSVKDGALENPWRTLIWPLAKDAPALRHSIFALAAFHAGKQNPHLRAQGVKHMRQSMNCLARQAQNMRPDAALATSLALAFADTWDQHTRTCIQHLRGAKALMSQVIAAGMQQSIRDDELDRIRFLYNTWSYMDVISRLTSLEECGPQSWDSSVFELPGDAVHDIDPLMGCATTLYPLMSQVATLIQHVRKTPSNTVSVVAQAMELKDRLEQWNPPRWFEPPDDPHSEVQHSIQVAHAYRWATLLYLHQAVPEIPSEPADELAKRVLILLATVPYTSRTTIIQMFPLLAAGAEVDTDDDRKWVLGRWSTIQSRLMLGGVDRCLEVLKEVWKRRDAMNSKRGSQLAGSLRTSSVSAYDKETTGFDNNYSVHGFQDPTKGISGRNASRSARRGSALASLDNIEHERTVRGKSHWVNVMADWGWEGQFVLCQTHSSF
ncbi:uncharacterized protein N7515_002354 [Penicillium bovifimosum]|uniref:Zn(2)-C6 fungal-type domain-containing protein n=1 Tax=Penicillium bovifimosum TaxID=126998 RepID=A0A9W9L9M3_9EURO|nr:uncharacterized protein N7515_002354 [Penicillium bovifimosum]KAJ5143567.1 hypothetical protein N7515_002354 [Penicillium bovifimosum]